MCVNNMINELIELYEWLYDNYKKEFINAKNNNLIYSYSSFEKLEKELNKLNIINNEETKFYINNIYLHNNNDNFYEYIKNVKNEYLFIANSTKRNSYQYTTKILSWYSITLKGINNMIIYQGTK